MNPFLSISVTPSYGNFNAVLSWQIMSDYADGRFFIYRSDDGITNWKLLNPQGHENIVSYEDTDLVVNNRLDNTHYKITVVKDGKRYDSHSIGFFNLLTKREYGTVKKILSMEYKRMDAGKNGIPVILYKRKRYGELCNCVDHDTLQSLGTSQCTVCYGTTIKGGYFNPVKIFIEQLKKTPKQIQKNQEGLSSIDTIVMQIRALAYPELITGDLIVNESTDERWQVETSQTHYFKGIIPIVSDAQVTLARRDHILYKLENEC